MGVIYRYLQEALLPQTNRATRCVSRKSCQLLHNSVGITCTSPEQIEVMELEGYSRLTCNKLVHSATTRSTVVDVIHKLTVNDFCWPHQYTDELLWRHLPSPKCRNYSLRRQSVTTKLILLWSKYIPNLKSLGAPVTKLWMSVLNAEIWWFYVVKGHSRSWAMPPFDRAHTTSYST